MGFRVSVQDFVLLFLEMGFLPTSDPSRSRDPSVLEYVPDSSGSCLTKVLYTESCLSLFYEGADRRPDLVRKLPLSILGRFLFRV